MDCAPHDFQYPSTRYSGSKRRFLGWILENIGSLEFDSVLDVFGGTGSVSLMFKRYGKEVLYNDLLKCNQLIGTAIRIIANISRVENQYKRAIFMASLFQACLAKRPFNLFHRANLYLRLNEVPRTFGNKTTWERPFPELFGRYITEYNRAVFSNDKRNRVIGGFDAINSPNGVDLVYLDPPYFSGDASQGTNYLAFYHFLEGLSDYKRWAEGSSLLYGKTKRIPDNEAIQRFTKKDKVLVSFAQLLERFQDSTIVLSYQDEGIPSREEILCILRGLGKKVEVFEKPHRYALSRRKRTELLFVAT